jgi:AcrR family transcriptional regulator
MRHLDFFSPRTHREPGPVPSEVLGSASTNALDGRRHVTAPSRATPTRARATRAKKGSPATRERLNRDQVVAAAVAVADEQGIDSLTMRNLSQPLGVVPMALYKHVANKEELLELMVDLVFAEIEYEGAPDWRAMVYDRALALREALVRHPWAIGLMETGALGPARLRDHETLMRCLRDQAGLSIAMALHAISVLDGLVYGFALQQRAYAIEVDGVRQLSNEPLVRSVKRQIASPEDYPYFSELLVQLADQGYAYGKEFEFGLDLLLDGIERRR